MTTPEFNTREELEAWLADPSKHAASAKHSRQKQAAWKLVPVVIVGVLFTGGYFYLDSIPTKTKDEVRAGVLEWGASKLGVDLQAWQKEHEERSQQMRDAKPEIKSRVATANGRQCRRINNCCAIGRESRQTFAPLSLSN